MQPVLAESMKSWEQPPRVSYALGSMLSIRELLWCASQVKKEDAVWIPETWGMECFSMLAAVSERSPCYRIGTSIVGVYSRSPATLAMGAATVDTISGGRLVLGLGASSAAIVEGLHGYEYEQPLQHVRESVGIIRTALQGKRIEHDGPLYHTGGFSLLVGPQRRIPICLAAVNEKMVKLAWEIADGVIFYLRPRDEMARTIGHMQEKHTIRTICPVIAAVSNDMEAAYDRARRTLAFYVSVGKVYRDFLARNGYSNPVGAIYDEYVQGGLAGTYRMVPDGMLRDLTICGTPQQCREQLYGFADTGIDEPVLQFNPVGSVQESFRMLQQVVP